MFRIVINSFTEENAKEICKWQYDDELDVYNYGDWHKVVKKGYGISNQSIREKEFISFYFNNDFIGYGRIAYNNNAVKLGIGMKPDICGKGIGSKAFGLLVEEAKKRYPHTKIALSVRKFNNRAVRCYEKNGFISVDEQMVKTRTGTDELFLEMVLTDSV